MPKYDLSAFDKGTKSYDLSAFDKGVASAENHPGMTESALRGAAQGASLGFADELTGGGEALADLLSGKTDQLGGILEAYRKHRDESRMNYQAAEEENPWTYNLSNVAGSFAIPAGALGTAGKAATFGERALAGLKAGALAGGITTAGGSQKDITQGEGADLAKEALTGAATGGVLGAGAAGVLPALGNKIKDFVGEFKGTKQFANAFNKARAGEEMFGAEAAARETEKTKDLAKNIGKAVDEVRGYAGDLKGKALEGGEGIDIVDKYKELNKQLDEIVPASVDEERLISKYKSMLDKLVGKTKTQPATGVDEELASLVNEASGTPMDASGAATVLTRPTPNPEEIQKTKDALGKILFKNKDLPYEAEQAGHKIRTSLEDTIKSNIEPEQQALLDIADKGYSKAIEAQSKLGGLPGRSGTTLDARMYYDKQVDNLVDSIQKNFANPGDTDAINLKNAFDITKKNIMDINDSLIQRATDPEEIAKLTKLKEDQLAKITGLQKQVDEQGLNMITTRHMMGESPFGGDGIIKKLTGMSGQASTLQTARKAGNIVRAVETTLPDRLTKLGTAVYDASPEALQGLASSLKAKGSPYADRLMAALRQPDRKRKALLFTLMQQPGFREELGGD